MFSPKEISYLKKSLERRLKNTTAARTIGCKR